MACKSTVGMDRTEWLLERTKGIGGSDAAAICGLDPFRTAIQVWMEKTGQTETFDLSENESVYWGTRLEDIVADEFAKRTGMWVQRRNALLVHPDHSFMIGNVDRIVRPSRSEGQWGVLDCKTTSEYRRDDWTEDTVPENYVIQLQHYMAVLGFQYGYLAVLIGGNKFRYFRVERDEELIQNLIRIEQEFWEEHVVKGVPPAWDGSPASTETLNKLFPGGMVESIELPAGADELITQYESASQLLKHAEYQKDEAANKLKALLGDYELGFYGKRRISWKTIAKKGFDSKEFRKDYPDLYEQYQHDISYRRFNIK
jgi:putative phage-type endonuclease